MVGLLTCLIIRELEHLLKRCQLSLISSGFIEHETHGQGCIDLDFPFPAALFSTTVLPLRVIFFTL